MTPTERAIQALPTHLQRYVVPQDCGAYTPRDHAVWRHILGRLTEHLKDKAVDSYLRGLEATGIGLERIPSLDEMNEKLSRLGWSAVSVRGFIPPAVFTELQSLGVLAIAADIRTFEHVDYTPAPDIVHESAGHAPILSDSRYAEYLKRSGVAGFKAIASVEDQAVFEAIRNLSVVKEDPTATPEDVRLSEDRLQAACASRRYVSENTKASRLYWWTAEYGLVGGLEHPKIYGAGLLSSIGEAERCLSGTVQKMPLSLVCAETEYDITTMQPQLFVARDFDHLFEVLEDFESTMAWKRGGDFGLQEALRARTVNHLVLTDGLELSGKVVEVVEPSDGQDPKTGLRAALSRLEGPVLLSRDGHALQKPWPGEALVVFGKAELPNRGAFKIHMTSSFVVTGFMVGDHEVINLRAQQDGQPLNMPSWGLLFISEGLPSVAGGPADPGEWDRWFGEMNAFAEGNAEAEARARKAAALSPRLAGLYEAVRAMRENRASDANQLQAWMAEAKDDWLLTEEIHELLEFERLKSI
ncbi:MAG: aromatic amino acid hydroxylase [Holophagaceae bacterium]|nr:aromatic amino acid hydroxylase [Holophagaceae bacterium]